MAYNTSIPLHQSLENILTYNHCVEDIIINYILILLLQITILFHEMGNKIVACSTIYLWGFQVMLCFIVNTVGVSVIWSAQLGILIHHRGHRVAARIRAESPWAGRLFRLSLVIGGTAWIYYAVLYAPRTTLAHFCALVMGLLMDKLAQHWNNRTPPL